MCPLLRFSLYLYYLTVTTLPWSVPSANMDWNPAKRRKLEHRLPHQDEPSSTGAADALDAAATAGTSRPSAFILQTQELLRELRINYDKSFAGADDLLRRIKSTIEAIHPQGATPVSRPHGRPTSSSLLTCPLLCCADPPGHSHARKEAWHCRSLPRSDASKGLSLQGLLLETLPSQHRWKLCRQNHGQIPASPCH